MKPFLSLLVFAALLLTAAPSEARSRRSPSANSSGEYSGGGGGGGLARDRGISSTEATAIGAVIQEIAHSPAPKPNADGTPKRKRSADYYRVYAKRNTVVVIKSGKPGRAVFRPKAKL